jgi:hypothetical protein
MSISKYFAHATPSGHIASEETEQEEEQHLQLHRWRPQACASWCWWQSVGYSSRSCLEFSDGANLHRPHTEQEASGVMEGTSAKTGPLTQLDANIMAAILVHLEPADLVQVRPRWQ